MPAATKPVAARWPAPWAPPPSFSSLALASSDAPTDIIGIGDTLAVSVYEPGGGLFSGMGTTTATSGAQMLPPLVVTRSGSVPIPFAGEVNVQGLTPSAACDQRRGLSFSLPIQTTAPGLLRTS